MRVKMSLKSGTSLFSSSKKLFVAESKKKIGKKYLKTPRKLLSQRFYCVPVSELMLYFVVSYL
jgi:hypothetical protein